MILCRRITKYSSGYFSRHSIYLQSYIVTVIELIITFHASNCRINVKLDIYGTFHFYFAFNAPNRWFIHVSTLVIDENSNFFEQARVRCRCHDSWDSVWLAEKRTEKNIPLYQKLLSALNFGCITNTRSL